MAIRQQRGTERNGRKAVERNGEERRGTALGREEWRGMKKNDNAAAEENRKEWKGTAIR